MSFDDDFDVPLVDNTLDTMDIMLPQQDSMSIGQSGAMQGAMQSINGHYYTIYPFYFNSCRVPLYIRSMYKDIDVTVYHLTRALDKLGMVFKVEWKRHPADLFHNGRVQVQTDLKKKKLLHLIGEQIASISGDFNKELEHFKDLAENGDYSKEDYIMVVDPFYIPKSMRKESSTKEIAAKKSKKKKK